MNEIKITTLTVFGILATLSASADPLLKVPSSGIDSSAALAAVQANSSIKSMMQDTPYHLLKMTQLVSGPKLQTIKFQHYYLGLEVEGSIAFYQVGKRGAIIRNRVADFDLDIHPYVSQEQAIAIALSHSDAQAVSDNSALTLKILPDPVGNTARLIYEINVDVLGKSDRVVTIDAHSGAVIGDLSNHLAIAPVQVYNAQGQGLDIETQGGSTPETAAGCTVTELPTAQTQKLTVKQCQNPPQELLKEANCQLMLNGDPIQIQVSTCPVAGADTSAARAQQNSEMVLNYYANHFNRDSYDGNGSPLISIVHGGLRFDNAYWSVNDKVMLYGDGDGKVMGDFTQGVDVAGHEMTHGVTMETAKLSMMGESGALNEANSDFFGIMIANGGTDWVLGKQLFLPGAEAMPGQENAVRDLANPGNITFCAAGGNGQCTERKPDPATMSEMMPTTGTCDASNDNCWVHINATILGHASYLVSQAIGAQKAEQLYYNTLAQSLSARDNLTTAAQAYKQTCSQLFDADTCTQVSTAFSQVGL